MIRSSEVQSYSEKQQKVFMFVDETTQNCDDVVLLPAAGSYKSSCALCKSRFLSRLSQAVKFAGVAPASAVAGFSRSDRISKFRRI